MSTYKVYTFALKAIGYSVGTVCALNTGMNVLTRINCQIIIHVTLLLSVFIFNSGFTSKSSVLQSCLENQSQNIEYCFSKDKSINSLKSCYEKVDTLKSDLYKEKLKNYCFYRLSDFKNVGQCLVKARLFSVTESHDAAVFDCYLQFQWDISKQHCFQISKLLRYPDKKRYLETRRGDL